MPVTLRMYEDGGHPSRRPLRERGLLRVTGKWFRCNAFPAHPEEAPSSQAPSRRMRSWQYAAAAVGDFSLTSSGRHHLVTFHVRSCAHESRRYLGPPPLLPSTSGSGLPGAAPRPTNTPTPATVQFNAILQWPHRRCGAARRGKPTPGRDPTRSRGRCYRDRDKRRLSAASRRRRCVQSGPASPMRVPFH
jgi:hypothetical protein